MNDFLPSLLLLVIALISRPILSSVHLSLHEKRFRAYLQKRGNHLLRLSYQEGNPFGKQKDAFYIVTYATPENNIFRAYCRTSFYSDFFWTEPRHIGHLSAAELERMYTLPMHKSVKEQLMDYLTSPYRHERSWAAQEITQSETVDPAVIQLVAEIALFDPDESVRAAAMEAVNKHQPSL